MHQQVVIQQQQAVPVQIDQTSPRRDKFPRRTLAVLGIGQIVIGILAIVFGVIAIVLECNTAYVGTGIWCGAYFIVVGSLGCVTSRMATKAWIVTSMVLSIIAAVFSGPVFTIMYIFIIREEDTYIYDHNACRYDGWRNYGNCYRYDYSRKAIDGVLLTLAIIETILAVAYASLCCQPVCNGPRQVPMMYYVAAQPGGVPVMGVPQTTPAAYMMPAGMQLVSQPGGQQFQVPAAPMAYPQQFVYAQPQAGIIPPPQQPQIPLAYQGVASGVTPPSTSDTTNTVKVPLA